MQPLTLLYEGHDVRVFGRRSGERAAITFSAMHEEVEAPPFGDRLLMKAGLTAVHMVARKNHWWQSVERAEAGKAAREFLRFHRERVTFGCSMGGYGALAWAGEVAATRIVAIAPQTHLSGRLMPQWQRAIAEREIRRDAVPDDIPPGVVPLLLYDPTSEIDDYHAQWLAARRTLDCVKAHGVGHSALAGLRARGVGSEPFAGLLRGDLSTDAFRKIVNRC